jgi:hypothetical protein
VRLEGLGKLKKFITPTTLEPATFRLAAYTTGCHPITQINSKNKLSLQYGTEHYTTLWKANSICSFVSFTQGNTQCLMNHIMPVNLESLDGTANLNKSDQIYLRSLTD